MFILSDSPPEKDVQWSEEGIISSSKFIQKLWSLHLKITAEIDKEHQNNTGKNLVKFTNQFIKKMTDNLNNFNYNVIIANMYEMYSFLLKEIMYQYSPRILLEKYKKILITIMPIIPHFTSECLKLLNVNNNVKWPKYNQDLLEEDFINIVIQINGKKRGLLEAKKNISETELLENIKRQNNIKKYLYNKEIKKKIFVPNKLMNIII